MKTIITCALCAAALSLSANVNAQEAVEVPVAQVAPSQMAVTVAVDATAGVVLPGSGWALAEALPADSPVDVTITMEEAKDKESGKAVEGVAPETYVSFKGKSEGKASVYLLSADGHSRTVEIEVVK